MKFILFNDVGKLKKGEQAICIEDWKVYTHTDYEGIQGKSLKEWGTFPKSFLNKIIEYLNSVEIKASIKSLYRPKGSLTAAQVLNTLLKEENLGHVYNISEAFTTTEDFLEGAGLDYPAGTNVGIVEASAGVYKFDALSGLIELPDMSQDIEADEEEEEMTVSPKAVKTYVDTVLGDIEEILEGI